MSIFKAFLNQAASLLTISDTELEEWRARISEEAGEEDFQHIRNRQLGSATKSSTPLSQQITCSEQVLTDMQAKLLPIVKALVPKMLALEFQQQRISRLHAEHELARSQNLTNSSGGLRADFIEFCKQLRSLGAGPSQVRQFAKHDVVIVADLARWKGQDPRYEDPANPLLQLRDIYANRTMYRPNSGGKAYHRSQPGAPPPNRFPQTRDSYWRFGPGDAVTTADASRKAHNPLDNSSSAPTDHAEASSVMPAEETGKLDDSAADPARGDYTLQQADANSSAQESEDIANPPVESPIDSNDDYRFPTGISREHEDKLLKLAELWIDGDEVEHFFNLDYILECAGSREADQIAAVELAAAPKSVTPYRYFLDVAGPHGVHAGRAAYRAATVRRVAVEIATRDENRSYRVDLGIDW